MSRTKDLNTGRPIVNGDVDLLTESLSTMGTGLTLILATVVILSEPVYDPNVYDYTRTPRESCVRHTPRWHYDKNVRQNSLPGRQSCGRKNQRTPSCYIRSRISTKRVTTLQGNGKCLQDLASNSLQHSNHLVTVFEDDFWNFRNVWQIHLSFRSI